MTANDAPRSPASDGGAHPDAQRMAEFVDGVLPAAEREAVERHLAACADCRATVVNAAAFLASEAEGADVDHPDDRLPAPEARNRRWPYVVGGVLSAAAIAVFTVRLFVADDRGGGEPPELAALAAAMATEPARPVEGRVTGEFAYAPPPPVNRGAGGTGAPGISARSPEVRIAVANIERAAAERGGTELTAALGVAHLVDGNLDEAIGALEQATRQMPMEPRYWSDLAAAYLAAGLRQQARGRLLQAVEAADRALALEPRRPEAAFNRAMALEALGDAATSIAAWQEVADIEGASGWAQEARQHLQRLSATP